MICQWCICNLLLGSIEPRGLACLQVHLNYYNTKYDVIMLIIRSSNCKFVESLIWMRWYQLKG